MESIAMRCTREQFDGIKAYFTAGEMIEVINLEEYPYLQNMYEDDEKIILGSYVKDNDRLHYEEWDAEIFLKACGKEIDKVFEANELQFWTGIEWKDCNNKYRLKP